MEQVIALIYEIQKIIESQKEKNKEKITSLEEAKETVLQSFNDKANELAALLEKYQDLSDKYETLQEEKENIVKENEEKLNSFREKTLGTVKYLVSRIENFETQIVDKDNELSDALSQIKELEKHLYDKNSEEKIDLSQYVTVSKYNEDIQKVEADKQTALENTWKEQKHLTSELEKKNNEILGLTDDISRLTNTINTLTTENSDLKTKNIEAERKSEKFNDLVRENNELNIKINELSETLRRTYEGQNDSTPSIKRKIVPANNNSNVETIKKPIELKDEHKEPEKTTTAINGASKFHFGVTTKTVIDKLVDFIREIYKDSVKSQDNSFTILSNLKQAKERIGLSDKEYDVFVNRLQEMEGPNGMPLLVIVDNKARSYFDRDWMIQYVSSVV